MRPLLDRFFRLAERGTNVRTEMLGGLTTFVAMAYIIVVNPAILQNAGMDPGPGTVSTILASAFGCLLMGFYANRPIAVAPYMGENAFLAFGLIPLLAQFPDEDPIALRLATVFVAGIVFLVLTLLKLRTWLARAISPSMKHSFAVGIGLFLLLLGLNLTGIIQRGPTPQVPVVLGNVTTSMPTQLAIGGFVLMALLMACRVKGAILVGMIVTGIIGYFLGLVETPDSYVATPWSDAYRLDDYAFRLDIAGVFRLSFLPFLLTLILISFLDTLGTLLALNASIETAAPGTASATESVSHAAESASAGPDPGDKTSQDAARAQSAAHHSTDTEEDLQRPMLVDAISCIFSALVGTSTSGAYIESATGIRDGARTGLAAIVTGLLFAGCLFFIPTIVPLQSMHFAYGPALMIVGMLMFASVKRLEVDDLTELVPALATIAMMVFTYNIANGLTAGLILYPVLKVLTLRTRELHAGSVLLGVMCLLYYVVGKPH